MNEDVTWKFEISPRTHLWVTEVSPINDEKRPEKWEKLKSWKNKQHFYCYRNYRSFLERFTSNILFSLAMSKHFQPVIFEIYLETF